MTTKSSFASSDDLSSNQFNMIQKSNDVNRICFYLNAGIGLGNENLITKFSFRQV